MRPSDLVLRYFPKATNTEVNDILWRKTKFPFCDMRHLEIELKNLKIKELQNLR